MQELFKSQLLFWCRAALPVLTSASESLCQTFPQHTLTRASMFSMLGCNLSCVFKPPLLYVFIKSPAPVADLYCRHYCFHLGTLLHNRVVSERWLLEYRKLYFKRYREAHLLQMFRKKNDFLPCLDLLRVMTILQSQAIKPNQTESTAEV